MRWLLLGGVLNFGIAILHVVIIVVGAPAYLYFGVEALAQLASANSPLPALLTSLAAIGFSVCGAYALAGAGRLRLPFARAACVVISALYLLRGSIVFLDIWRLMRGADYPLRQTLFSAVALVIGLIFAVGLRRQERRF